jgi:16S rRNA processing protein RimM
MSKDSDLLEVARIGKAVGLSGELKLHLHCDFPEQFQAGKTFKTQKGLELEIFSYNPKRGLVKFCGFESRDSASTLINSFLFTSIEETKKSCQIEEDELFWFDIIGLRVVEEKKLLGFVDEIERIGSVDYMVVKTDDSLVKAGFSKRFYIPFIDRYVVDVKRDKEVLVKDGLSLLENS